MRNVFVNRVADSLHLPERHHTPRIRAGLLSYHAINFDVPPLSAGYRRAESFLRFSVAVRGAILTRLFIPRELRPALSYFSRLCRTRASCSDLSKVLGSRSSPTVFFLLFFLLRKCPCHSAISYSVIHQGLLPPHMTTASYFPSKFYFRKYLELISDIRKSFAKFPDGKSTVRIFLTKSSIFTLTVRDTSKLNE